MPRTPARSPIGRDGSGPGLLFIGHSGEIGGGTTLLALLAREAGLQGRECTVICPRGAGQERADWGAGARLMTPGRIDESVADHLEGMLDTSTLCVAVVSPETAPLIPWLVSFPHCLLLSLGNGRIMREWLSEDERRMFGLALRDNPHLGVALPRGNEGAIEEAGALYGVEGTRIHWVPPITTAGGRDPSPVDGADGRRRGNHEVLFPGRLSPERLPTLTSAAEFAAQSGCPLRVVGTGGGRAEFEESLRASACEAFEVVEQADLTPWLHEADVVVAAGLTALEALACGCSVLIPRAFAAGGGISTLVTPASFGQLHRQNFTGLTEALTADEAWEKVRQQSHGDRAELARLVARKASPRAGLHAVMDAGMAARNDAGPAPELLRRMARETVRARALVQELTWWSGELAQARDHYRAHGERLEAALRERDGA